MSDLISRSELLKAFNNKNVQITFDLPVEEVLGEDVDLDDFAMLVQDAIQSYKKLVIDTIMEQQIAYDIDNVIGELEKAKVILANEYYCKTIHDKKDCENSNCFECCADYLIEIVKQGGVSDD